MIQSRSFIHQSHKTCRFIWWEPRTQKSADICALQPHRVSVSRMKCAGPLRQWELIPINIPLSLISIKVRVIRRCYGRRLIAAHVDDVTRRVSATSSGNRRRQRMLFFFSLCNRPALKCYSWIFLNLILQK